MVSAHAANHPGLPLIVNDLDPLLKIVGLGIGTSIGDFGVSLLSATMSIPFVAINPVTRAMVVTL